MQDSTKSEKQVRSIIGAALKKHGSLRKMQHLFPKVSIAALSRIVKGGPMPITPETRAALNLPCLIEVAVCPVHGIVHQRKCHPIFAIRVAQSELKESEKEAILAIFKSLSSL